MRKLCTALLSGVGSACTTIIPVRPGVAENSVRLSGAKSKDALFVLASLLMVAALAGCGGGGGGGKTAALPTPVAIDLPQGIMLEPGAALTIPAGEKRTVHEANGMRTEFTCPADGQDCVVSLTEDGAPQSTGGTPTVATYTAIEGLPSDHTLRAGAIPAGDPPREVHSTIDTRTEVTCPAGGEPCVVSLGPDGSAQSTGGTPTVTTYTTLYPPSGTTLTEGTIPAGERRHIGGNFKGRSYDLVCPFDGEACEVILGDYEFESTGGAPYFATKYYRMVWDANNGPDGTSDGAHASILEGRLVGGSGLTDLNPGFGSPAGDWPRRHTAVVQNTKTSTGGMLETVTPTVSRASSGAAPTWRLTVANTGSEQFSVDRDSHVPSLGRGWNGAVLHKPMPGTVDKTVRAVMYSDIEGSADTYYTVLGSWLRMPDSSAAASTEYDLGVFAYASSGALDTVDTLEAFTGTASYTGPATGLYSAATYTGTGATRTLESATVGSFTATATINADFGATTTAWTGASGTVTGFMEDGEPLGDWTVNLPNTNTAGVWVNLFRGVTSGGQADGRSLSNGNWAVLFHRRSASGHPDLALGVFTASTAGSADDALHIAGSFAAGRQ